MEKSIEQIVKEQAKEIDKLKKMIAQLDFRLRRNEKMTSSMKENIRVQKGSIAALSRRQ